MQDELFPSQPLREEEVPALLKLLDGGVFVHFVRGDVRLHKCARKVEGATFETALSAWRQSTKPTEHDWDVTNYDPCGRNDYKCRHCGATR